MSFLPPLVPSPYSDHQNCRHTAYSFLILLLLGKIQSFSLSFLKAKILTIEFSFHQPSLQPYAAKKNPT
ncbi:hypothetical protein ACB092_07G135500 [Castanea dentata]